MEWKGYGWWYMSAMQRSKSFEKVKTRRAFGWGRISPLRFVLHFSFFFIFYFNFFLFQPHYLTNSIVNSARMHCLWIPQNPLFNYFFIKNGSYNTIYTFKNYFATVFSVSVKISSIQTDPRFPFHF